MVPQMNKDSIRWRCGEAIRKHSDASFVLLISSRLISMLMFAISALVFSNAYQLRLTALDSVYCANNVRLCWISIKGYCLWTCELAIKCFWKLVCTQCSDRCNRAQCIWSVATLISDKLLRLDMSLKLMSNLDSFIPQLSFLPWFPFAYNTDLCNNNMNIM